MMLQIVRLSEIPNVALPIEINRVLDLEGNPLVIFLMGKIDPDVNDQIRHEVHKLDPDVDVLLCIDSGGGRVMAANGIASRLSIFTSRLVVGLVLGKCCSAALDIYLSIPKKYRFSLPGTDFMFHSHTQTYDFRGQVDIDLKTIDGKTLPEMKRFMSRKLEYMYEEAMKYEMGRIRQFASYIDQLRNIGSRKSRARFMAEDYHFGAITAKKIGVVNTIVDLVNDNWVSG